MAHRALVEVLGDASGYFRAGKQSQAVTAVLGADLQKLAVKAKASADAQVAASVRKTSRLRNEVSTYREIAAAAKKGSREQVAAANLAARAQVRLSRSLGVTKHESLQLAAASASAERTFGRFSRGALVGSGVLGRFGRAAIFASNSVLGGVGLAFALKSTISAAEESQRVLGQTRNATERSGVSWLKYGKRIQEAALAQSNLSGFDDERLLGTFSAFVRRTGDVNRSLTLNALAANVARGRNIQLEQAQQLVLKASIGQAGALRRLGINAQKGANGIQLIDLLQRKYAGSAAAYGRTAAGAQDRFRVAVENTQELLGGSALPTITKYLNKAADWLSQSKNQKQIQHDLGEAITVTREALKGVRVVLSPVTNGLKLLRGAVGGTAHEVEVLGLAFGVLKAQAKLRGLEGLGLSIAGIGTKSSIAASEVGLLKGSLLSLKKIGAIAVTVVITEEIAKKGLHGFGVDIANKVRAGLKDIKAPKVLQNFFDPSFDDRGNRIVPVDALRGTRGVLPFPAATGFPTSVRTSPISAAGSAAGSRSPLTLGGRFNLAELALANAQLTKTMTDDRTILTLEAGITRQQVASAKTLKGKTQLTLQLAGILSQIRGIDTDIATQEKEAAKAAKERAHLALQTRQFKVLGLDPTGNPFTPGFRALRKELGTVGAAVKGTSLDTTKNKGLLGNIHKLLFGKNPQALIKEVRDTIKQMLDGINDELKNAGPKTGFKEVSLINLTGGLGLTGDARKALEGRLAQLGADRLVPTARRTAFAGGFGGADIVVHTHVKLDGRDVAVSTTRHQQKTQRRNPAQKRGPHAGGGL